jgi:hypothetical protein
MRITNKVLLYLNHFPLKLRKTNAIIINPIPVMVGGNKPLSVPRYIKMAPRITSTIEEKLRRRFLFIPEFTNKIKTIAIGYIQLLIFSF